MRIAKQIDIKNFEAKEHLAWIDITSKLQELLNITKTELNERQDIRQLAGLIEKWGYMSYKLRLKNNDDSPSGLFWQGEVEEDD